MSPLWGGVTVADITPQPGIDLCGFARRQQPSTGILDRLRSRNLYLSDHSASVIISSNDLVALPQEFCGDFLRDAQSFAQPPKFFCAATHTHSGPATIDLRCCGSMDPSYINSLQSAVSRSIQRLGQSTVPVEVGASTGSAKLSRNRRDGETGVVDDTVTYICFREPRTQRLLASICSYGCHPVVMGHESTLISPDYPGYLCAEIEARTGAPCLFLNGPCGDINPIAPEGTNAGAAQEMGETLAHVALESMHNMRWIAEAQLATQTIEVTTPLFVPKDRAHVRAIIDELCSDFSLPRTAFDSCVTAMEQRIETGSQPSQINIELSLLAIGDEIAIFFVPGEMFAATGLAIRKMSPWPITIVSTLSNGSLGYLPTKAAFSSGTVYEPFQSCWFYDGPMFTEELEGHILDGVRRLINT